MWLRCIGRFVVPLQTEKFYTFIMQHNVLVTGANGQLGKSLQALAPQYSEDFRFIFTDVEELDITQPDAIREMMRREKVHCIINAAAYTAVDKAESDVEKAYLLNETAVLNLAQAAQESNALLIHVSTDYVFDGQSKTPYTPDMMPNPLSVYGKSKWAGEQAIMRSGCKAVIVRTEWLYSPYGNNFVKTMLRLASTKESIGVVNDQVGCPTLAADLANLLIRILQQSDNLKDVSVYHFANRGKCSWYDFACEIMQLAEKEMGKRCQVNPISTAEYPTAATRPNFSLFDLSKTAQDFHFDIPDWRDSLRAVFPQICHNFLNDIR